MQRSHRGRNLVREGVGTEKMRRHPLCDRVDPPALQLGQQIGGVDAMEAHRVVFGVREPGSDPNVECVHIVTDCIVDVSTYTSECAR